MKFLIAFVLCFFCVSYEASAIYSVEKQGIFMPNSTRSMSNSGVPTIQKQRYKERVILKYRQFKSKVIDNKWVRRFLTGGIVLLILGLALFIPFNRLTSANSTTNPSVNQAIGIGVGYLLGIASLIVSGVFLLRLWLQRLFKEREINKSAFLPFERWRLICRFLSFRRNL